VIRVRDGQIIESRDYVDHAEIARALGRAVPAAVPVGGDWRERARQHYEDAVFDDDAGALDTADQELDAIEASLALARGRIRHARFLLGGPPDDATLATFERSAELHRKVGDARGEAEALFWAAAFCQVARDDSETALPLLERSGQLAAAAGDPLTLSYVARHIGFADQDAGRPGLARQRFTQSLQLRREIGFQRGVAAALLALAELTARHGDPDEAGALLAEALETARASGARGIQRRIEQSPACSPRSRS
jgi:tetratricopeptide (TPR) repeat protein